MARYRLPRLLFIRSLSCSSIRLEMSWKSYQAAAFLVADECGMGRVIYNTD